MVPAATESWRESIVRPMPYAVSPPFSQLTHLSREAHAGQAGLCGRKLSAEQSMRSLG